jgi:hypothetical protein
MGVPPGQLESETDVVDEKQASPIVFETAPFIRWGCAEFTPVSTMATDSPAPDHPLATARCVPTTVDEAVEEVRSNMFASTAATEVERRSVSSAAAPMRMVATGTVVGAISSVKLPAGKLARRSS